MPKRSRLFLKKISKTIGYLLFLGVSVLLLLEMTYRYYLIDFYSANFNGLNSEKVLESKENQATLLAMGDSFTADRKGYIAYLREKLPDYQIINSAVPGTCVKQSSLMFPSRVGQYEPRIFLYQLYVGNDLLEYRHPLGSTQISLLRKTYWWLSDRLWVLGYLNSRLPHLRQAIRHDLPTDYDPKALADFSLQRYSARSKMHFRAEPYLIENTAMLKSGREKDMKSYIQRIERMIKNLPADSRVILLVIPHCMQLNETYRDRMLQLGAKLEEPPSILQTNYPFLQALTTRFSNPKTQVINALPALREASLKEPVYYDNDPHLNAKGQEVLGKLLVEAISQ